MNTYLALIRERQDKEELVTCTNEYDVMEKSLFFDESHESDLVESIDEFSLREEMTLPASENSKKKNQRQDGFWKSISEKFMSYQNNISKTRRIITLLGNFRLDTRESPWMQTKSFDIYLSWIHYWLMICGGSLYTAKYIININIPHITHHRKLHHVCNSHIWTIEGRGSSSIIRRGCGWTFLNWHFACLTTILISL
ncbi:hypothetical protein GLOIN_2v1787049 [Rhizophagus irregularis DAOM 181602=DAOM 197198]|nr:hypothetical protein GLOIN_2v1787049 [Rhizophagus irregularis DAOM 181602=DAOM 197198]